MWEASLAVWRCADRCPGYHYHSHLPCIVYSPRLKRKYRSSLFFFFWCRGVVVCLTAFFFLLASHGERFITVFFFSSLFPPGLFLVCFQHIKKKTTTTGKALFFSPSKLFFLLLFFFFSFSHTYTLHGKQWKKSHVSFLVRIFFSIYPIHPLLNTLPYYCLYFFFFLLP